MQFCTIHHHGESSSISFRLEPLTPGFAVVSLTWPYKDITFLSWCVTKVKQWLQEVQASLFSINVLRERFLWLPMLKHIKSNIACRNNTQKIQSFDSFKWCCELLCNVISRLLLAKRHFGQSDKRVVDMSFLTYHEHVFQAVLRGRGDGQHAKVANQTRGHVVSTSPWGRTGSGQGHIL